MFSVEEESVMRHYPHPVDIGGGMLWRIVLEGIMERLPGRIVGIAAFYTLVFGGILIIWWRMTKMMGFTSMLPRKKLRLQCTDGKKRVVTSRHVVPFFSNLYEAIGRGVSKMKKMFWTAKKGGEDDKKRDKNADNTKDGQIIGGSANIAKEGTERRRGIMLFWLCILLALVIWVVWRIAENSNRHRTCSSPSSSSSLASNLCTSFLPTFDVPSKSDSKYRGDCEDVFGKDEENKRNFGKMRSGLAYSGGCRHKNMKFPFCSLISHGHRRLVVFWFSLLKKKDGDREMERKEIRMMRSDVKCRRSLSEEEDRHLHHRHHHHHHHSASAEEKPSTYYHNVISSAESPIDSEKLSLTPTAFSSSFSCSVERKKCTEAAAEFPSFIGFSFSSWKEDIGDVGGSCASCSPSSSTVSISSTNTNTPFYAYNKISRKSSHPSYVSRVPPVPSSRFSSPSKDSFSFSSSVSSSHSSLNSDERISNEETKVSAGMYDYYHPATPAASSNARRSSGIPGGGVLQLLMAWAAVLGTFPTLSTPLGSLPILFILLVTSCIVLIYNHLQPSDVFLFNELPPPRKKNRASGGSSSNASSSSSSYNHISNRGANGKSVAATSTTTLSSPLMNKMQPLPRSTGSCGGGSRQGFVLLPGLPGARKNKNNNNSNGGAIGGGALKGGLNSSALLTSLSASNTRGAVNGKNSHRNKNSGNISGGAGGNKNSNSNRNNQTESGGVASGSSSNTTTNICSGSKPNNSSSTNTPGGCSGGGGGNSRSGNGSSDYTNNGGSTSSAKAKSVVKAGASCNTTGSSSSNLKSTILKTKNSGFASIDSVDMMSTSPTPSRHKTSMPSDSTVGLVSSALSSYASSFSSSTCCCFSSLSPSSFSETTGVTPISLPVKKVDHKNGGKRRRDILPLTKSTHSLLCDSFSSDIALSSRNTSTVSLSLSSSDLSHSFSLSSSTAASIISSAPSASSDASLNANTSLLLSEKEDEGKEEEGDMWEMVRNRQRRKFVRMPSKAQHPSSAVLKSARRQSEVTDVRSSGGSTSSNNIIINAGMSGRSSSFKVSSFSSFDSNGRVNNNKSANCLLSNHHYDNSSRSGIVDSCSSSSSLKTTTTSSSGNNFDLFTISNNNSSSPIPVASSSFLPRMPNSFDTSSPISQVTTNEHAKNRHATTTMVDQSEVGDRWNDQRESVMPSIDVEFGGINTNNNNECIDNRRRSGGCSELVNSERSDNIGYSQYPVVSNSEVCSSATFRPIENNASALNITSAAPFTHTIPVSAEGSSAAFSSPPLLPADIISSCSPNSSSNSASPTLPDLCEFLTSCGFFSSFVDDISSSSPSSSPSSSIYPISSYTSMSTLPTYSSFPSWGDLTTTDSILMPHDPPPPVQEEDVVCLEHINSSIAAYPCEVFHDVHQWPQEDEGRGTCSYNEDHSSSGTAWSVSEDENQGGKEEEKVEVNIEVREEEEIELVDEKEEEENVFSQPSPRQLLTAALFGHKLNGSDEWDLGWQLDEPHNDDVEMNCHDMYLREKMLNDESVSYGSSSTEMSLSSSHREEGGESSNSSTRLFMPSYDDWDSRDNSNTAEQTLRDYFETEALSGSGDPSSSAPPLSYLYDAQPAPFGRTHEVETLSSYSTVAEGPLHPSFVHSDSLNSSSLPNSIVYDVADTSDNNNTSSSVAFPLSVLDDFEAAASSELLLTLNAILMAETANNAVPSNSPSFASSFPSSCLSVPSPPPYLSHPPSSTGRVERSQEYDDSVASSVHHSYFSCLSKSSSSSCLIKTSNDNTKSQAPEKLSASSSRMKSFSAGKGSPNDSPTSSSSTSSVFPLDVYAAVNVLAQKAFSVHLQQQQQLQQDAEQQQQQEEELQMQQQSQRKEELQQHLQSFQGVFRSSLKKKRNDEGKSRKEEKGSVVPRKTRATRFPLFPFFPVYNTTLASLLSSTSTPATTTRSSVAAASLHSHMGSSSPTASTSFLSYSNAHQCLTSPFHSPSLFDVAATTAAVSPVPSSIVRPKLFPGPPPGLENCRRPVGCQGTWRTLER